MNFQISDPTVAFTWYKNPSLDPTNTWPFVRTAGDDWTLPPVGYAQIKLPATADRQYSFPSSLPTYTLELSKLIAGDDRTKLAVVYFHFWAPVAPCKAYTAPSSHPMNTVPSTDSVGEDLNDRGPGNIHTIALVVLFTAYTLRSLVPKYRVPSTPRAPVETPWTGNDNVHFTEPSVTSIAFMNCVDPKKATPALLMTGEDKMGPLKGVDHWGATDGPKGPFNADANWCVLVRPS